MSRRPDASRPGHPWSIRQPGRCHRRPCRRPTSPVPAIVRPRSCSVAGLDIDRGQGGHPCHQVYEPPRTGIGARMMGVWSVVGQPAIQIILAFPDHCPTFASVYSFYKSLYKKELRTFVLTDLVLLNIPFPCPSRACRPTLHRVENREWCTDRTPMSKINNQYRKGELALALAGGTTVKAWAESNGVAERTAYAWARSREVLDQVDAIRRTVFEQAIGQLSNHVTEAAAEIARLAKEADSESVRLSAARAVLAELMSVSSYAALDRRMVDIERRLKDGSRFPAAGPGQDPTGLSRPASDRAPAEKGGESCPAS
jgi:hypothetical protein